MPPPVVVVAVSSELLVEPLGRLLRPEAASAESRPAPEQCIQVIGPDELPHPEASFVLRLPDRTADAAVLASASGREQSLRLTDVHDVSHLVIDLLGSAARA
jgi:hypothetical protein